MNPDVVFFLFNPFNKPCIKILVQSRENRTPISAYPCPSSLQSSLLSFPLLQKWQDLHYFFPLKDFLCITNSSSPRWHSLPLLETMKMNGYREIFCRVVPCKIFSKCSLCNTIHSVKRISLQIKLCWHLWNCRAKGHEQYRGFWCILSIVEMG